MTKKMETIILLTATVNCKDVCYCKLNDSNKRLKQYLEALSFYLLNTKNKIVFIENSGFKVYNELNKHLSSIHNRNIEEFSNRFEIITFKDVEASKSRGKGFGEARILDYAVSNSQFINNDYFILKISGRIIVKNIKQILKHITCKRYKSIFRSVHYVYGHMLSHVFACDVPTLCKILPNLGNYCNDYKKQFFEKGLELSLSKLKSLKIKPIRKILDLDNYIFATGQKYINRTSRETFWYNLCGTFWMKYLKNNTKLNKKIWKFFAKKTIKIYEKK